MSADDFSISESTQKVYKKHQEKVARREKEAKEEELMVKSGKARLHTREVLKSKYQRQKSKTSLSEQERRKRPSSADAVRRRPFSVMSFEPRLEGRSLEASYNLTAQLRLEMMERRREEEVRTMK